MCRKLAYYITTPMFYVNAGLCCLTFLSLDYVGLVVIGRVLVGLSIV